MVAKDKGLELACRFSSITNRLRYCGPKEAYKDLNSLLIGQKYERKKIEQHFRRYEGLYVYLNAISERADKKLFDYSVIEGYWIGNKLLDLFSEEDNRKIINSLVERGLPEHHSRKLLKKLPKGLVPHHSFNVFFIGVGNTTGSVPTNINTMNKCIVSIGELVKITDRQLILSVCPLTIEKGEMKYSDPEIQYADYDRRFLPELKKGDKIALHWDFACKILTKKEVDNLKYYTQKNIEALNNSLFFSSD